MEEKNVFTAKSVDEALDEGLKTMGLTLDEVDYEIIEEGKKGLFGIGTVKAQVKIIPKNDGCSRTTSFIDGLLKVIGVEAESEVVSDAETLNINIKTPSSARVIGKRGDVLDAIQCLAGAVANIGRDEYRKVVVDCENYRAQREQTLRELAQKLAKTAVETGRKMLLEPMTPYERRVIHGALMFIELVKPVAEGIERVRYVALFPNTQKPYDRGVRYGERRKDGRRDRRDRDNRGERRSGGRDRAERSGNRSDRGARPSGGAKRGKKEIYFGTFLGNSQKEAKKEETPEKKDEE